MAFLLIALHFGDDTIILPIHYTPRLAISYITPSDYP